MRFFWFLEGTMEYAEEVNISQEDSHDPTVSYALENSLRDIHSIVRSHLETIDRLLRDPLKPSSLRARKQQHEYTPTREGALTDEYRQLYFLEE
ncbi:hypothetical protein MRX96_058109 [Rhipicephalus microplus]